MIYMIIMTAGAFQIASFVMRLVERIDGETGK